MSQAPPHYSQKAFDSLIYGNFSSEQSNATTAHLQMSSFWAPPNATLPLDNIACSYLEQKNTDAKEMATSAVGSHPEFQGHNRY